MSRRNAAGVAIALVAIAGACIATSSRTPRPARLVADGTPAPQLLDLGTIGTVRWGQTLKHSLDLENGSDEALTFSIQPDCACSSARLSPVLLPPSKVGTLEFEFDSRKFPAGERVSRPISLLIQGNNHDGAARFSAVVRATTLVAPSVDVPGRVSFGRQPASALPTMRRTIQLRNFMDAPVTVAFSREDGDAFRVLGARETLIDARGEAVIQVGWSAPSSIDGEHSQTLRYRARTGHETVLEGEVRLSVFPELTWRAEPSTVFIAAGGSTGSHTVRFVDREGQAPRQVAVVRAVAPLEVMTEESRAIIVAGGEAFETTARFDAVFRCTSHSGALEDVTVPIIVVASGNP